MRIPRPLLVIMLAYSALAILYAVLTPPWETPDEPAHYRYVMQLADRWRPPTDPMIRQRDRFCRDYTYISSNYEWYHPALGYLPLAAVYRMLKLVTPHSLPADIPPFNPLFCSDPFQYPNLFSLEATHPLEVWQHNWGILILRVISSAWGLAVIYATYRTGQLLEMGGFEVVAAGWVAFLPQFTFINASVRNDTLSNAFAALLFLLSAEMQVFPQRRNRIALIMGLAVGTGMLTKLTLAYLIPTVLLASALPPSLPTKERIRSLACISAVSLALVALYYLGYQEARAALLYTEAQMQIIPESLSRAYWKPFFPMLVDLFFARFGWANVVVPAWWIKVAFGIWVLGAGLSLYQLIRLLKRKEERVKSHILVILFAGVFLAFAGVVRYNLSHFQPQGRFLFSALVGWALLGTWGISTTLPKRTRFLTGLIMMGFMLLFNLRSLAILASAYY